MTDNKIRLINHTFLFESVNNKYSGVIFLGIFKCSMACCNEYSSSMGDDMLLINDKSDNLFTIVILIQTKTR
jgi:hypothetical protein